MNSPQRPDPFETIREDVHARHQEYLEIVEPHRPELYRYARGLAGSIWDAEDLVQEALMRAFRGLGTISGRVDNLRAYLFRIVTNAWVDASRRRTPEPVGDVETIDDDSAPVGPEVREALERLVRALPPRERAVVMLREAFSFTGPEIATMLRISEGAVKAALHRGRARLAAASDSPASTAPVGSADSAVIDAFVTAFNARDLTGIVALLAPDAEQEIVGVYHDTGEAAANNILTHTVDDPTMREMAFETVGDERIAVIRYEAAKGAPRTVGDALRFDTTTDGKISRIRWYYFCPDSLRAIGDELGEPATSWGYRYGSD